jgi:hypothetical protein
VYQKAPILIDHRSKGRPGDPRAALSHAATSEDPERQEPAEYEGNGQDLAVIQSSPVRRPWMSLFLAKSQHMASIPVVLAGEPAVGVGVLEEVVEIMESHYVDLNEEEQEYAQVVIAQVQALISKAVQVV